MASDFVPKNRDFAQAVRESFGRQGALTSIGAVMEDLVPGSCRIRLPFSERVSQQQGFFHGGIIATVADSAGGYAAMTLTAAGAEVLTVEYKINFLAPAEAPAILAAGRVVRAGRTLSVTWVEVDMVGSDGSLRPCAILQQTIMTVQPRPVVV
jgi:uncharacterized protein (TIGR00369 family)